MASKFSNVGILDYGIGNLNSILNAVERLGYSAEVTAEISHKANFTHLIIPGVGAFGPCVKKLKERISVESLSEVVLESKIPTLGICVGMQLMFESSEEDTSEAGLSWFPGRIKKLKSSDKERVPHVGWNEVKFKSDSLGFTKDSSFHFYFDHSYAYVDQQAPDVEAVCDYSGGFSAIVRRKNIIGVQFHPEKSQKNGKKLLESFLGS